MKCKDCYKEGCSQRAYTDDAECVLQQWTTQEFDWQSFRAEAAKDILCKTIDFEVISAGGKSRISEEKAVRKAISYANELIKQLKEKEEK